MTIADMGLPRLLDGQKATLLGLLFIVGLGLTAWLRRDRRLDTIKGPRGMPLIGIGLGLPEHAPAALRRWAGEYGEVFKLRVGWYDWVVVNSPEAVREIFDKQVRRAKHTLVGVY